MIDQVSLVSAQQIVVGRQAGLPIPLSPLVAGILDTLANTASYNLPANVVLNQLEVFTFVIDYSSFIILILSYFISGQSAATVSAILYSGRISAVFWGVSEPGHYIFCIG